MKTLLFLFGNEVTHFSWVTFSVTPQAPSKKFFSEKNSQFQESYDTSFAVKIKEKEKEQEKKAFVAKELKRKQKV